MKLVTRAEMKDWLTAGDIAARLGVSRSRIYQLVDDHTIPCVRFGRSIRVPRLAWDAWLAEQSELALDGARRTEQLTTGKEVMIDVSETDSSEGK